MPTLWLIESKAAREYKCPQCGKLIQKGSKHYRHDPHPYSRQFGGDPTTHWCASCVEGTGARKENVTNRIRIPYIRKPSSMDPMGFAITIPEVKIVGIGRQISEKILANEKLIYQISPEDFEDLICDRLYEMGLEPKKVGSTYSKDGGVDIVFWPRIQRGFSFLGAAQVKHHKNPLTKEGSSTIRDFNGVMGAHPFNAGMIVTNTAFSPDAKWFAENHSRLVKLRELNDIQRWVKGNFVNEEEWREIPKFIELCPGVKIKIR